MDKETMMITAYKSSFKKYGDSELSLMWSKNKFENRFQTLSSNIIQKENFSVLDFGCGLAHLKEYLDSKYDNYQYVGVDIVDEFIHFNQQKHNEVEFIKIVTYEEIQKKFDYIFISGVFNVLFKDSYEEQFKYICTVLVHLFEQTNGYLAVNFMSKDVDFINEESYHQDVKEIYDFVVRKISKRVIIDQSTMPYEFTLKVFKDVEKIENVYKDGIPCK